jgi:hypothetical protein
MRKAIERRSLTIDQACGVALDAALAVLLLYRANNSASQPIIRSATNCMAIGTREIPGFRKRVRVKAPGVLQGLQSRT